MPDELVKYQRTKRKKKIPLWAVVVISVVLAIGSGFLGGYYASKYAKGSGSLLGAITNKVTVQENSATIDAVKKVSPSVVSIISSTQVQDMFGQTSTEKGGGSGFIISQDGLILTNKHVVDQANSTYTVFTSDGKNYPATIKSTDPLADIAVVKIDAKNLPVAQLGDSDSLQIGQTVIAIGNALGEFQNTVTKGVISAKERTIQASSAIGNGTETLQGLLQTDAPINPGNSGGPLVNLEGQVIGMNTAIASQAENIGFAIPINDVKTDIQSIIKSGRIIRPMLGVRYISVTKDLATYNNLSVDKGALVYSDDPRLAAVISGSPAARAGIKQGDIITALNGQKIDENHSLQRLLAQFQPGNTIKVTYIRDKKEKTVDVKLTELKESGV